MLSKFWANLTIRKILGTLGKNDSGAVRPRSFVILAYLSEMANGLGQSFCKKVF